MAVVNQKNPTKTVWKESSICTKTWNNSVLQFMKVSDMLEPEAGFHLRDTVVFVCEILDCCPWFDFSDLEVSKQHHKVLLLCLTSYGSFSMFASCLYFSVFPFLMLLNYYSYFLSDIVGIMQTDSLN